MLAAFLLLFAQEPVDVEGQPLAANAERLVQALELLGHPLAADVKSAGHDARKIQEALDPLVFAEVTLGGEGPGGGGPPGPQQGGYTPPPAQGAQPKGLQP